MEEEAAWSALNHSRFPAVRESLADYYHAFYGLCLLPFAQLHPPCGAAVWHDTDGLPRGRVGFLGAPLVGYP